MVKRKLPASNAKDKTFKKLTSKQWAVYYWLISKVFYNSKEREDHYFIYRNDIIYASIAKELNIGSVNTVKTAFKKLETLDFIRFDAPMDQDWKKIIIPHKTIFTYLSVELINFLLSWSTQKYFGAEIILYYSILKRYFELHKLKNSTPKFNTKLMLEMLGYSSHHTDKYMEFKMYLALLKYYGLVDYVEHKRTNRGITYIQYTLIDIKEDVTEYCNALDDEIKDDLAEALMNGVIGEQEE